jgi:hypothetical protein
MSYFGKICLQNIITSSQLSLMSDSLKEQRSEICMSGFNLRQLIMVLIDVPIKYFEFSRILFDYPMGWDYV